ncbi:MAG: GNAT family N-acetyltransferase [Lautropia sp.]
MASDWRIEPLGEQDRSDFDCGVEALNRYLRQQAGQDAKRFVATTWLLTGQDGVAGYYTLSASSVDLGELSPDQARQLKLPRYPKVPVTLLGRLAVDARHRGLGLGQVLLVDALERSFLATSQVASVAVIVDAKDEQAEVFYARHGFLPFPDLRARLFMPMGTIARLIAPST